MRLVAILLGAMLGAAPIWAQDDERGPIREDELIVCKNVHLRARARSSSESIAILYPGTVITRLDTAERAGYLKVQTQDGEEGWVWGRNVRPLLPLESETEESGHVAADAPPGLTAGGTIACPTTFGNCPNTGCLANQHKRKVPPQSGKAKFLDFATLREPQRQTDKRDVEQGKEPPAGQRKALLGNFSINGMTISEGDHVAVAGFVAADRRVECGGAELVNCKFDNSDAASAGPCDQSDIHVPIVPTAGQMQVKSIVVEPIPQAGKPALWTPPFFTGLKDNDSSWCAAASSMTATTSLIREAGRRTSRSGSHCGRSIPSRQSLCAKRRETTAIHKL